MFGNRLKTLRKERKITQGSLAKAIGITQGFISDLERGEATPGSDTLLSISRFFDVDPYWLRTGQGEMRPQEQKQPLLPPTLADIVAENLAHYDVKKTELSEGALLLVKLYNQMTPEDQRDIITQAAMRVIAMGVDEPKE